MVKQAVTAILLLPFLVSPSPAQSGAEAAFRAHWAKARTLAKKGDWRGAAAACEAAHQAAESDDGDLIEPAFEVECAVASSEAQLHEKALTAWDRVIAVARHRDLGGAAYRRARVLARLGRQSDSRASLAWAVYLGFKDWRQIERESDLAALRLQPDWKGFFERLRSRKVRGPIALRPGFEASVRRVQAAFQSGNAGQVRSVVVSEAPTAEGRALLLRTLQDSRDLTFSSPVRLSKEATGMSSLSCSSSASEAECTIMVSLRQGVGGSTYEFTFRATKPGEFRFVNYLCSGGCDPL